MENCPELRKEVLQELMESLPLRDYICFGAINPSWSAIAKKKLDHPRKQMQKVPLLVFKEDRDKDTGTCFFNVFNKKLHHTEVQELRGRRFNGLSFGWLITVDINFDMNLLNPLSRVEIKLPKLFSSSDDFAGDHFDRATFTQRISLAEVVRNQVIRKVILTADPGKTSDYLVIVFFDDGVDLSFWRPGDLTWTIKTYALLPIIDVIWYKESIYIMSGEVHDVESSDKSYLSGSIYVFDFNSNEGDDLSVEEVVPFRFRFHRRRRGAYFKPYLVDIMGDLFIVIRKLVPSIRTPRREMTFGFEVFKIDQSQSPMQIIACESIGDHVLFLGCNNSIVVSTAEMDEQEGDLIYFTDDYFEATWNYCKFKDMGVYDMKLKRKFYLPDTVSSSLKFPPVFVEANPF